jgi:site-specific DNA recombinase
LIPRCGRRLTGLFRDLVHSVVVTPFAARQGFQVEVKARLAELVGANLFPSGGTVVPQERLELPTPSLRMRCSTN